MRWRNGVGHSLVLCILSFACAGVCVYRARQFAGAAPVERTTTARDVSSHYNLFRYLRFNFYTCNYNFSADGASYSGHGDCPETGGTRAGSSATVYYDPDDPWINSLNEFSVASGLEYGHAVPWILFGVFFILMMILASTLAAIKKRGGDKVVVDWHGTVLDPVEFGPDGEFGGLSGDGQTVENRGAHAPGSSGPPALRSLFLGTVNGVHPDRASNEEDRALRERLMKAANAAFERGDAARLREILDEYKSAAPPA
jgi:hypothetical protein